MESSSFEPPGTPPPGSVPPQQPSVPRADAAAAQIDRLLTSAERVAAEVRANAEAHARRELEEARGYIDEMTRERVATLSDLTEAMVEHATVVAAQCESLLRKLEETMRRLGGTAAPAAPPAPARQPSAPMQPAVAGQWSPRDPSPPPPVQATPAVSTPYPGAQAAPHQQYPPQQLYAQQQQYPAPSQAPASQGQNQPATEDAYLRATRLALDGYDRAAIAQHLRIDFGIADPEPLLDSVLGAR